MVSLSSFRVGSPINIWMKELEEEFYQASCWRAFRVYFVCRDCAYVIYLLLLIDFGLRGEMFCTFLLGERGMLRKDSVRPIYYYNYLLSYKEINYGQSISMLKILLTINLAFFLGKSFLDYNQQHTLSCQNIPPGASLSQTLPVLWNIAILHKLDRIAFLIFCPLLIIGQLLVVVTYYKFPTLFNKPGDIFFGILLSEFGLTIHLLATAIYHSIYSYDGEMPPSFITFCTVLALQDSFFIMVELQYMFFFLIYAIFTVKTSLKQRKYLLGNGVHFLIILLAIGATLFFWFDDFLGLNNEGLCAITAIRKGQASLALPAAGLALSLMFIIVGIYSWNYFRKNMPKTEGLQRRRYSQNKLISIYVGGVSVFMCLLSGIGLAVTINCYVANPQTLLTVWASLESFCILGQYFFLLGLMLTSTPLRKKAKKLLRSMFTRDNQVEKQRSSRFEEMKEGDIGLQERILEMRDEDQVIDILKVAQIITVLAGIHISHREYLQNFDLGHKADDYLRRIHYNESICFALGTHVLADYKIDTQILPKIGLLDGMMTIHAPRVFKKLLTADGLVDIDKSFDLFENYEKIYHLMEGQGGKSGQFFFFSSDNKYVLKTINNGQYQFITENLESFVDYFLENPHSLLAKIYGVYTIKGNQLEQIFHLILMRNIVGCSKSQVLRTYDMKGSKYDREVIKANKVYKPSELSSITLKDTDFMKLEGKLHIDGKMIREFRSILRKDSHFLKSLNLIDYSLLVVRVQWPATSKELGKNNISTENCVSQEIIGRRATQEGVEMESEYQRQRSPSQTRNRQLSNLSILQQKQRKSGFQSFHRYQQIQSTVNPDQYYHIGVIDYMQKWDLQKKGEKWWKSLLGMKQVSAEEPNKYQKRFMNFIDEITYSNRFSDMTQSNQSSVLGSGYLVTSVKQMLPKFQEKLVSQIQEVEEGNQD